MLIKVSLKREKAKAQVSGPRRRSKNPAQMCYCSSSEGALGAEAGLRV